jgi:hypothetical protein
VVPGRTLQYVKALRYVPPRLTRWQSEQTLRSPDIIKKAGQDETGTSTGADQGIIPHTTQPAAELAGDIAEGLKTVVGDAVKWVEDKVEKLGNEREGGLGPYASPASCDPSGLYPLASGIKPAMEAEKSKSNQVVDTTQGDENQCKRRQTEEKKQ